MWIIFDNFIQAFFHLLSSFFLRHFINSAFSVDSACDESDDLFEYFLVRALHELNVRFDFLLQTSTDNHFVPFLHEEVEFFSQSWECLQSLVHFGKTFQFIIGFLVSVQAFEDIFVGTLIGFPDLLQPFLCLFYRNIFH